MLGAWTREGALPSTLRVLLLGLSHKYYYDHTVSTREGFFLRSQKTTNMLRPPFRTDTSKYFFI